MDVEGEGKKCSLVSGSIEEQAVIVAVTVPTLINDGVVIPESGEDTQKEMVEAVQK